MCVIQGERAKEKEKEKHSSTSSVSSKSSASSAGTTNGGSSIQNGKMEPTWVHDIFEGILTNETRCLCCETVSCNLGIQYIKMKNSGKGCIVFLSGEGSGSH